MKFARFEYPTVSAIDEIDSSPCAMSRQALAMRSFLTMALKVSPLAFLKYFENVGSDIWASRAASDIRMRLPRLLKM